MRFEYIVVVIVGLIVAQTMNTEAQLFETPESDIPDSKPELHSCFCTFEFMPVCGSDGTTYANLCELECERNDNFDLRVTKYSACEDEAY